jgi:hypothetical protein
MGAVRTDEKRTIRRGASRYRDRQAKGGGGELTIRIKGWKRFQHFKDRRPIWIKLYRDILDDLEWHELDPVAAKHLVMFWLVASEDGGQLPSVKELAFRLRSTEKQVESTISKLSHYLEQDDITLISEGYQNDSLEKRREETEKSREEESIVTRPKGNGRFTPPTLEEVSEYCKARGNRIDPIKYHAHYTANGWRVGKNPMKDWKAAVVTWERGAN